MKRFFQGVVLFWVFTGSAVCLAYSGPSYVTGEIINVTSLSSGLLIRIGGAASVPEVPQNCTSGHYWMFVKQDHTAMISLVLASWAMGKSATVYTSPESEGYCQVTQFDPAEN